ncbi:ribosomal-protein-alanine N-acetyltransferase [Aneurinibacillus soli]|uniref:Putative ribosomal N-acetyltransferase YdaF n=1 Tax=Aneurinibacillus soli TaxID=1500254 RepID=A0A0U4WJU8_9BACL|nr:GNAT family protein [Aneurinibacillus soli]PYE57394.1 ribosomal-protein-alanine N-acetyltransferase [Aneurinibacillus soli]BAU28793.1 putative ribosomal N-acetyltransferase YdaF [Aneurinibacillus soli]
MSHTSQEFPQLETKRLLLRKMSMDDAPTLFRFWSDEKVTKYMNIPAFQDVSQATEMIDLLNNLASYKEAIRWGIVLKETNELVGSCGYNNWVKDERCRGEIGYDLGKEYWGQGIAAEALEVMLDYGFTQMKLNRVEALVEPENIASIKLLKKIGFQKEGLLRDYQFVKGNFINLEMYSLLKRECMIQDTK